MSPRNRRMACTRRSGWHQSWIVIVATQAVFLLLVSFWLSVDANSGIPWPPSNPDIRVTVSADSGRVSLSARNADIRQVLGSLSNTAGIPISAGALDRQRSIEVTLVVDDQTFVDTVESLVALVPGGGMVLVGMDDDGTEVNEIKHIYILISEGNSGDDGSPTTNRLQGTDQQHLSSATLEFYEEVLRERNHLALLNLQKEIAAYLKNLAQIDSDTTPQIPDFREWAGVLYKDALLTQLLLEEDLTAPERYDLLLALEEPEEPRLDFIGHTISSTNPYYPAALRELITVSVSADSAPRPPTESMSRVLQFEDLVSRRKRYSDSYFITKMRNFLLDDRNSLDDKVEYMTPYIEKDDEALVRYGASYFNDRLRSGAPNNAEKTTIRGFQKNISKGRVQ